MGIFWLKKAQAAQQFLFKSQFLVLLPLRHLGRWAVDAPPLGPECLQQMLNVGAGDADVEAGQEGHRDQHQHQSPLEKVLKFFKQNHSLHHNLFHGRQMPTSSTEKGKKLRRVMQEMGWSNLALWRMEQHMAQRSYIKFQWFFWTSPAEVAPTARVFL